MIDEEKYFNFAQEPGKVLSNRNILSDGKPLISIITAYYNAKKYIMDTANSIFDQTFPYWEWIIVNDGSTEQGNVEILEELSKKDKRIKIYHKENEGLPKTRDYALNRANCDLVYIMDADDLIDKTMFETCYWSITTNPEATWVFSNSTGFQSKEYLWDVPFSTMKEKKENVCCGSTLIKKEAIFNAGGYAKAPRDVYEDWHLWLRFLAMGYKPIRLNFYGFWYRITGNSGVLNSINSNKAKKKNALKIMSGLAKKIKKNVGAIQFPASTDYDYNSYPVEFEWDRKPINIKGEKKRILFILPWTDAGGADIFNLNLIKGLKKKNYEVTVITTESHEYKLRRRFEEYAEEFFDLTTFLKREDWAGFLHYIIKSRNIDLVFQSNSFYGYHIIPWLKCKFPELPFVDYLHAEDWSWRDGSYPRDSIAISRYLDKTYTCTNHLKNIMYTKMNKKIQNTEVVYIGTDSEYFDPNLNYSEVEDLLNKYAGKKVILFPCRLEYLKRPILAIKILNEICKNRKDITLVIVGDGSAKAETISFVNEYGLNNYVDFVDMTHDVRPYYKIANLTLICSLTEGLTLTAYESLSMGIPVVSSDVGGQKELIDDKCGKIIKAYQNLEKDLYNFEYSQEEINEYVNAINTIIDNKQYNKIKKYCREKIVNGFSLNDAIESLSNDFESIINSGTKINKNDVDNIEIAERYLILFNEYTKVYYDNPDSTVRPTTSQILWRYRSWRIFVRLLKKLKIIQTIKKYILKTDKKLIK